MSTLQEVAAAQRLHYRPSMAARQLRIGRSGWLGVLMNLDQPGSNLARLAGLERAALARGYRLVVGRLSAGESIEDFLARGLDGLFWLHPAGEGGRGLKIETRAARALVSLDEPMTASGCCVRVDYTAGLTALLNHLDERGRKRPGLVAASKAELTLFQTCLRAAGHPALPGWVRPESEPAAWSAEWLAWLTRNRLDALLCTQDAVAASVLKAARDRRIAVPGRLAVTGWGDTESGRWTDSALTTVDEQPEEWARAAMTLMTRLLEGASLPVRERSVDVRPRVVARESA